MYSQPTSVDSHSTPPGASQEPSLATPAQEALLLLPLLFFPLFLRAVLRITRRHLCARQRNMQQNNPSYTNMLKARLPPHPHTLPPTRPADAPTPLETV